MTSMIPGPFRFPTYLFASLSLATGAVAAASGVTELTLARDGQPAATIVVAGTAGQVPWFAASELQSHIRKITGATLPIVTDDAAVLGTRILVGASRQTETLNLRNSSFAAQEYLIGFRTNTLILMGRDREDDGYPVRLTGRAQRVAGRFGQAMELGGVCQAVSVADHGFADEAGTLETWVWLGPERAEAGTIFRVDGSPWTYHIVDTQGRAIRYVVYDGQTGRSVTSGSLPDGWHHLCATHDARAGQIELFVDDASCGTAAYGPTTCSNAPFLHLGAFLADGRAANQLRGRLDEVHVARVARPPAADWATRPRAADADTLARLSFDEPSGPPRERSGRPRRPGPPALDDNFSPMGTSHAVHDFLERFCDVRWYAPTDLGMVFTPRATLTIRGADVRRKPAFEFRRHAPSGIAHAYVGLSARPTAEEERLFIARRRLGGTNYMTNHSFYDYYDRFWDKNAQRPDLFAGRRVEFWAKGYAGRPPQLCYTSSQLVAQVVKDARARLDAGADFVPLVPMDNDQQCRCPDCQALLDKETRGKHFSTGKASGLFWNFANAVAREVRQSHPDKFVGALAYYDYAFPPRFAVEANLCVGPCLHTRNWWAPAMERNDLAFYRGWLDQAPGRLHCVWLYQCFPYEIAETHGFIAFPGFHAHTLARQFQMLARDRVRGIFLCGVADYVDGYLTFRSLDDPFFDLDAALEEFFTRYYGPAAPPLKALYLDIERTYMTPANYPEAVQREDAHFHQSEEMAWKHLGTSDRMAGWAKLMEQARAAATTPEQRERVAVFAKDIWGRMVEGRRKWEAKQKQ